MPRGHTQGRYLGAILLAGEAAGDALSPSPGPAAPSPAAVSRHDAAGAAGDEDAPPCPGKRLHQHLRVRSTEIEATAETSRLCPDSNFTSGTEEGKAACRIPLLADLWAV